jgi:hypothetical protein
MLIQPPFWRLRRCPVRERAAGSFVRSVRPNPAYVKRRRFLEGLCESRRTRTVCWEALSDIIVRYPEFTSGAK